MSTREETPTTDANSPRLSDGRGARRIRKIFRSLHDCMIRKGYVKTTLADIAGGADMSASHLLYYFVGKEDILEQYFDTVSVRFLQQLETFSQHPSEQQIDLFTDWWFNSGTGAKHEIGFMLECFGIAVHDEVLKVTKSDFDIRCKSYLRDIFQDAKKLAVGSAEDSAELAYSMMIGLRSAVYFDDSVTLDSAHKLFNATLKKMYGL